MACKIHSYPNNPRVYKTLIAAQYTGVKVELTPDFQLGVTNKSAEFLTKFPFGKVPVMDTPDGPIFESNAMAFYVAQSKNQELVGANKYEMSLVQQYINMADNEISPAAATWIYPILGYVQHNEANTLKAKEDVSKALNVLNQILLTRTFLVGESVTLADITVVCSLYHLFKLVLDPEFRKPFANVTRWFTTCVEQPQFKAVLGETKLCTVPATPETYKCASACPATSASACPASACPASACPASACPASRPAATASANDEEDDEPLEVKSKNPLDLLPAGKLNMDAWKRFYSNNETRPTAINYFWDNFDKETFSMFRVTYKYNNELTKIFMSSNLVGGFFQRLEELRKYAFGVLCVYGEDNNNAIYGMFIIRGKELPEMLKDVPDYESYDFVQVNPEDAKIKTEWEACIAWDGEFEGKKFADGKVYK